MRTKDQGILGEGQVLAKFVELGIPISIPFGDNASYDLVAEFNGKLNKIQIKSSTQTTEDVTLFKISKTRINSGQNITTYYTADEVDYYALYNIAKKEIYLVPFNQAAKKEIPIRHTLPKNNQVGRAKLDKDYLIDTVLEKIIQDEE